jgi:hypothetical protein
MTPIDVWYKLRSKILEKTRGVSRGLLRALAVIAIIAAYGLGQVAVTGFMMTASTTSAQAWWRGRGWGWRGRGWRGRGWGYRGWRRGW